MGQSLVHLLGDSAVQILAVRVEPRVALHPVGSVALQTRVRDAGLLLGLRGRLLQVAQGLSLLASLHPHLLSLRHSVAVTGLCSLGQLHLGVVDAQLGVLDGLVDTGQVGRVRLALHHGQPLNQFLILAFKHLQLEFFFDVGLAHQLLLGAATFTLGRSEGLGVVRVVCVAIRLTAVSHFLLAAVAVVVFVVILFCLRIGDAVRKVDNGRAVHRFLDCNLIVLCLFCHDLPQIKERISRGLHVTFAMISWSFRIMKRAGSSRWSSPGTFTSQRSPPHLGTRM